MFSFNKKRIYPIGVDLGTTYLRMAQLGMNGQGPFLVSAGLRARPESIEPSSAAWQRWAAGEVKKIWQEAKFKGKDVVTALPSDDLFIDPVKISRASLERVASAALSKVQKRLPFSPDNALLQYIVVDQPETRGPDVEVLVIAAERETVNRHLAIYEKAGLNVVGISIWPTAMMQSYTSFFCRRQNEQERTAILLDVGTRHTNVVICRADKLLFARVIAIGYADLDNEAMGQRLLAEIDACVRYYEDLPGSGIIERMVFLTGSSTANTLCEKIAELAQQMQVHAQIGDVLCAVEMNQGPDCMVDRRNSQIDWATVFGLSLGQTQ